MDRMIEVVMPRSLCNKLFYADDKYIDKIREMKDYHGHVLKVIIVSD